MHKMLQVNIKMDNPPLISFMTIIMLFILDVIVAMLIAVCWMIQFARHIWLSGADSVHKIIVEICQDRILLKGTTSFK